MAEKTRKIRVILSALTRMEYSCVVEVPESFGEGNLYRKCNMDIVRLISERTDGGDYVEDLEFWENGTQDWEEEVDDIPARANASHLNIL